MEVVIAHAVIWSTVIIVGMLLYIRSDLSRKQYRCSQCGERIAVELMEAANCPSCGAHLEREA
ncbi:MAG: hypothetical protein AB7S36_04350 [Planctomycetota bacterium]